MRQLALPGIESPSPVRYSLGMRPASPDRSYVLGVDPGLAHCGLALLSVARTGLPSVRVLRVRTVETKRPKHQSACEATHERALRLHLSLRSFVGPHIPLAIATEAMSFPRNASASQKMGVAWGVLSAFAASLAVPLLATSPQQIKKRLVGTVSASKEEVGEAVSAKLGARYVSLVTAFKKTDHEHIHDAAGAALTLLEAVRALPRIEQP